MKFPRLMDGQNSGALRFPGMKKYCCALLALSLLAACEQKETSVTTAPSGSPVEKKEPNTTIVNPPAVDSKTTTKTDVQVKTSPSP